MAPRNTSALSNVLSYTPPFPDEHIEPDFKLASVGTATPSSLLDLIVDTLLSDRRVDPKVVQRIFVLGIKPVGSPLYGNLVGNFISRVNTTS